MRSFFFAILFFLAALPAYAQNKPKVSLGLGIGTAFGVNESLDRTLGPYSRAYLTWVYGLGDHLSPEIGIGIMQTSGDNPPAGFGDYRTQMIPIDLRLRYVPFLFESWSPYIYGGFGLVSWNSAKEPPNKAVDGKPSGTAGFMQIGGGLYHRLNYEWGIEIAFGTNQSFTDDLNDAHDDMNDGWWQFLLGVSYRLNSGPPDGDDDGLSDADEVTAGTDPQNADSDNDGISDGNEVNEYRSSPLNTDTDGDGIPDHVEIEKWNTDPISTDTDRDGASDAEEINTYHTDPTTGDSDADGLTDGDEVNIYQTNPSKVDTDDDTLSDREEVQRYKTNPLSNDTDGDGLLDGDELNAVKTNPLNPDSDHGGTLDGIEVRRGTNPLDENDDIPH